jgi:TRAP-type C4-dicarboxylate transport system permease small subunit
MNLNWLYKFSGILAAICLLSIALLILSQVIGRFFNILIPSANDFAGYFMAASTFLALASTFRSGGHIRVTMLINNVPKPIAHLMELFALILSAILTAYFTWFVTIMVYNSFKFDAVTQGHIPIPLWFPQSFLAIGLFVLCVAILEDLIRVIRKLPPSYQQK